MKVESPEDFRCPISLEVMADPVILASGHTFDRPSIQRWLDSGNRTCPVSQLPLPGPRPSLIPNLALRSLISSSSSPSSLPLSPQSAAPSQPVSPADLLARLAFPSDAAALSSVLRLAKRGAAAARRLIADSGAVPVLLRHAASPAPLPVLQDLALRSLIYLSLDGDDARVGLVAEGAVDALVPALSSPAAALAATVLTSLAVVDVNKCTIGAHPSAIAGLAELLRAGSARERREAATALYELCKFPDNRRRAVRAGAVPALVGLAAAGSERAVEVLGLVAKCQEGSRAMRSVVGVVKVLAVVLRGGRPRVVENALLVLNLLSSESEEVAMEAIKEGALELCLGLLQDDAGDIGKKAAAFARTLERVHPGRHQ